MKRGRMKWCDKCGARLHSWQEYHNGMCSNCIGEISKRLKNGRK